MDKKSAKDFWEEEVKPVLLWYCLEKHVENLVAINVQDNVDNIKWTYDVIGEVCAKSLKGYCDTEKGSSDGV